MRQRRWSCGALAEIAATLLLSLASTAAAQTAVAEAASTSEAPRPADTGTGIVLGAKLGGGIGAPFNQLGVSFIAELELGYRLPLPEPIGRSFELFSSFAYAAPHTSGSIGQRDPRLPGDGRATYALEQQIAALTFGLLYRLELPAHVLSPYAAAGARLHMMRTKVHGDVAGQALGENQETSSAWGAYFAGGIDVYLGPGAVLVELQLGFASVNDFVLRDTNVGVLNLMVGYRLFFSSPPAVSSQAAVSPQVPVAQASAPPAPPAMTEPVAEPPTTAEPAIEPPAEAPASGEAAPSSGAQLRGHVRAFSGKPLTATVTVYPRHLEASTDEQGYFELDIPPGRYTVRLRAHGYKSQSRKVEIQADSVTVLNVELGKK